MKALILAAGLGKRLEPITHKIAKPALEFLNIPMLFYSAELLTPLDCGFVINAHHFPSQIEKLAAKLNAEISLEKEMPLGSGGAVWRAKKFFANEKYFVYSNGDEVMLPESSNVAKGLAEFHEKNDAFATILVVRDPRVGTQFNGIWADPSGRVKEMSVKVAKDKGLTGFHFTGIQILSSRIYKYLPEGESNIFHQGILPAIAKGEKVYALEANLKWFETGDVLSFLSSTKLALEYLGANKNSFFQNLLAKRWGSRKNFWEGTGCNHALENLRGRILLGNNCSIHESVKVKGFAVFGDNVTVEAHSIIENSVICRDKKIGKNQTVADAIFI